MNGYNYQSTGMTHNQLPQLTPISNLSTRPYQQDSPGPSQTLPPLHTQNTHQPYPSNVYRDSPHTPRTPQSSASTTGQQRTANLSQIAPQPAYSAQQQHHHYPPLAPNYSSGHAPSFPGLAGHGGGQTNGNVGPYAPMTLPQPPFYDSPHNQDPSLAPNSPYSGANPQGGSKDGQQRVLAVVGSQGRRGVLPTNTGRAPPLVTSADGTPGSRVNAVKGPDGRYSCQYCNKVYLHLKHLKRHHLRHTGERPYQCHLCHETFCRSDILKRHFTKCALRRGNPTGANHLTHAQAHLGRPSNMPGQSQGQANGSAVSAQSTNPALYRTSWQPGEPNGSGQAAQDQAAGGHPGGPPVDSNLSSRSSSIIRPGSSNAEDKKRFSGTNTNITSVNNSIDTSPTSSGALSQNGERKPTLLPNSVKNDPLQHSASYGSQQSSFYNGQPSSAYPQTTQNGPFPSYQYHSPNGYRSYHSNQYDTMQNEHLSHYFQPGGQDAVMFTHQ